MRIRRIKFYAYMLYLLARLTGISSLWAEDPLRAIRVTPEYPTVTDQIRVLLTRPYQPSPPLVTVRPSPETLILTDGPVMEPGIRILEQGEGIRVYRIHLGFRSTVPGYVRLPEIEVRTGADLFTYPEAYVGISLPTTEGPVIPPRPRWVSLRRQPYVNETVVLKLVLRNSDNPSPRISVPGIPIYNSFIEAIDDTGIIKKSDALSVSGPVTLYEIAAGTILLTPQEGDALVIPDLDISIDDYELPVPGLSIPLKPLPPEAAASSAVGRYSVDVRFENPAVPEGNLRLLIRVTGTGNLPFLNMPEPFPNGLELVRLKETEDIRLTSGGYAGYREAVYVVKDFRDDAGVTLSAFFWVDPDSEKLESSGPLSLSVPRFDGVSVLSAPVTEKGLTEKREKPIFAKIPVNEFGRRKVPAFYTRPYWFCVYIPGIVLIFLGIRKRHSTVSATLFLVLFLFAQAGRVGTDTAKDGAPKMQPSQWYNQGVSLFNAEQYPPAIVSFRQALKASPMDKRFRNTLSRAEKYLALRESTIPVPHLCPDIPLFGSSFLLLGFGLVLNIWKGRGIPEILAILLFLALASGILFGYAYRRFSLEEGVLNNDTSLFRIPAVASTSVGNLKRGVCVRIMGSFEGYSRIRSGTGMEAWIPSNSLLLFE